MKRCFEIEEYPQDYELDSTVFNNIIYRNYISKRVKNDIDKGLLTEDDITFSMIDIPNELYDVEEKDFIIDCKGTNKRLVITKSFNNFFILLVRDTKELPIY